MACRHQRGPVKKGESRSRRSLGILLSNHMKIRWQTGGEQDCDWFGQKLPRHAPCMAEAERLQSTSMRSILGAASRSAISLNTEHELLDHAESLHAKTHTTVLSYDRIISQSTNT